MKYNIDCNKCVHFVNEDYSEACEECSIYTIPDDLCSCHINPLCRFCESLKFEEK